jgi:hypothetical protein
MSWAAGSCGATFAAQIGGIKNTAFFGKRRSANTLTIGKSWLDSAGLHE